MHPDSERQLREVVTGRTGSSSGLPLAIPLPGRPLVHRDPPHQHPGTLGSLDEKTQGENFSFLFCFIHRRQLLSRPLLLLPTSFVFDMFHLHRSKVTMHRKQKSQCAILKCASRSPATRRGSCDLTAASSAAKMNVFAFCHRA